MGGPRDYGSATEKALFALASGTCYYPGCTARVIVFVEGRPANNMHMAHIRGAKPGSARFDASMTDPERAHFDNLLLLCKPHHDLIDSIAPTEYPEELLLGWKRDHLGDSALLAASAGLTAASLEQALLAVGQGLRRREVSVELGLVVTMPDGQQIRTSPRGLAELRKANPGRLFEAPGLVTSVTNTGFVPVSVASTSLYFGPQRLADSGPEMTLMGRNDFPFHNPRLPQTLGSGEGLHWQTSSQTVVMHTNEKVRQLVAMQYVHADARLATGEAFVSNELAVDQLG